MSAQSREIAKGLLRGIEVLDDEILLLQGHFITAVKRGDFVEATTLRRSIAGLTACKDLLEKELRSLYRRNAN